MTDSNDVPRGGIHHVAMRVANFDECVAFYTDGLGFPVAHSWGEGEKRAALLDTGGGNYLEVFAGGQAAEQAAAIIHFALRTDDVDGLTERARAAGAEITVEPKDVTIQCDPPLPVRLAFCKGPAGETIEFFHEK